MWWGLAYLSRCTNGLQRACESTMSCLYTVQRVSFLADKWSYRWVGGWTPLADTNIGDVGAASVICAQNFAFSVLVHLWNAACMEMNKPWATACCVIFMLSHQMEKKIVLYKLLKNKLGNASKACINVDVLHGQALVSDIQNKARELQLFWWAASSYESAIDDLFSHSSADKAEVCAFSCAESKSWHCCMLTHRWLGRCGQCG